MLRHCATRPTRRPHALPLHGVPRLADEERGSRASELASEEREWKREATVSKRVVVVVEEKVVVVKVVVQSEGRGGNDGNAATQGWRRAGEERLAASEREGEGEASNEEGKEIVHPGGKREKE